MMSKVEVLKHKVMRDIRSGRLRPGDTLPSRHQLMRRYACARGTVDAAISALGRDGYVYSRRGAGSFVADSDTSSEIGELYIFDNGGISDVIDTGIHSGRLAAEFQGILPSYVYDSSEAYLLMDRLTRPGRGVIWVRPGYELLLAMQHLAAAGRPQLQIGRRYGDFDYVTTDTEGGLGEGLEWLSTFAGNDLAYIGEKNDPDRPYISERQLAFLKFCTSHGINVPRERMLELTRPECAEITPFYGERLFLSADSPRGIFISHVDMALSLIAFAEAHGRIPGKDFFILVFDTEPRLCGKAGIAMLRQCWAEMGEQALAWINYRLRHVKEAFYREIKPEFIIGG